MKWLKKALQVHLVGVFSQTLIERYKFKKNVFIFKEFYRKIFF